MFHVRGCDLGVGVQPLTYLHSIFGIYCVLLGFNPGVQRTLNLIFRTVILLYLSLHILCLAFVFYCVCCKSHVLGCGLGVGDSGLRFDVEGLGSQGWRSGFRV